ncbi:hypothetical protein HJG60_010461 [Phyllostomus discolor]|uniref:Uncharacterized protein n=1 Tax=Phyllostomus discolor TaxID=89673 RepID=A0A834AHB5_9CHIR|nr:hypothetical protein HJG60_010461 [Phyllostomus discolor]
MLLSPVPASTLSLPDAAPLLPTAATLPAWSSADSKPLCPSVLCNSQPPTASTAVQAALSLREALEAQARGLKTGHSVVLPRITFSLVAPLCNLQPELTVSSAFFHRPLLKDLAVTPVLPKAGDPCP